MYNRAAAFLDFRALQPSGRGHSLSGAKPLTGHHSEERSSGGECSGTGGRSARGLGPWRKGPEDGRDRVRLQHRDRGRLDRPRLQSRRDARVHRRRRRLPGAGDPADGLRADVPRRRRLLLHEPSRPRLRDVLQLGDQGDGAAARLDGRLGDRRRRRDRDGEPRPDRRPLHLPALRCQLARRLDLLGDLRRRDLDHHHDRDRHDRDRALGPDPGWLAGRRGPHAGGLRGRGAGQGLCGQRTEHIGPPELQLDQPVRGQHHRDLERPAARRVHLLGLGHDGNSQ